MVGIAEISAALGGLKGAMDIVKGLNATADAVAINEAKIALQGAILETQGSLLAAQEAQTANLKRIDELEAKIVELSAWEGEKKRYQLQAFPTGVLAYVLKPDDAAGEPSHRLCPHCYQESRKSILQTTRRHAGGEKVECPRCKTELKLAEFAQPKSDSGAGPSYF
jgi:hypothetical protein